jgi:hypothetical protein
MGMQIKNLVVSSMLGVLLVASPMTFAKDKVVLSLQQDPAADGLEAACVALQLGTGLLKSPKEKAKVTIFATLDGVYIADETTYASGPECDTFSSAGLGTASLRDILNGFLNAGGEVLLCPLCFAARQDGSYVLIEDPQIYVASPIPLLLEANKVIDY